MADTKHSPAPFIARIGATNIIIADAFGDSICAMARETGDHPAEEQEAKARLIAAAPELLIAAEHVLNLGSDRGPDPLLGSKDIKDILDEFDAAMDVLKSAIAKARGEG